MVARIMSSSPVLLILLAGCAAGGEYPSLAPRPVERELGDLPPAIGMCALHGDGCATPAPPTPAAPVDDAGLRARLVEIKGRIREGRIAFEALAPRVRDAVNRAGPRGSDAWLTAQQQLSRLEGAHGPIVEATAWLDMLAFERASVSTTEADQALLEAVAAEAERADEVQREELAQLGAVLGAK